MVNQPRRIELRVLAVAVAAGAPTLFGVRLLELGRALRAFGWPWAHSAPSSTTVGLFLVMLYGVLAGVWMTRSLLTHHAVLTPRRRQLLTLAYVVLTVGVTTEI